MRIATLEDTGLVEIHRAFLSAFSDYQVPMDMPLDAFTHHLESNSYLPSLSLGAFTQDGLAGFILSGRRKDRLYDCGTGILASHRGCGLGGRLFDSLLPLARDAGIRQCVLEVLQENEAAVRLYTGRGFRISRELKCTVSGERVESSGWPVSRTASLDRDECRQLWDGQGPSWQYDFDSLLPFPGRWIFLEARDDSGLIGYAVSSPGGSLCQLAVRRDMRGLGIGRALTAAAQSLSDTGRLRMNNVGDEGLYGFLLHLGFRPAAMQWEMTLDL